MATAILADFVPSACPPMNGAEPTFVAPWQSRAFSMAVALHDAKELEWGEFQAALGGALDRATDQGERDWSYYIPWLSALEALLIGHGQINRDLLDERTLEILARSTHQHLAEEAET